MISSPRLDKSSYRRLTRRPRPAEPRAIAGEDLWFSPPATSGVAVTPESAMTLTAAFACMNVLATDTASIPREVYRRLPNDGRESAPEDPRYDLVHTSPDGEISAFAFTRSLMGHALGRGNGYSEIQRKGNGDPYALHLLDPATTFPERKDGKLIYRLANGRTLPARDVLHVAGLGYDGLIGYSPVAMARQAIGLGLAAESFGATFFGNGSRPSGILKVPQKLSKDARDNLRNSWEDIHGGPYRSNRLAILEQGADWVKQSVDPEDAQFLATRQFQVLEVCRIYRVPPNKVADLSQSHLANLEQENLEYLMFSLMGWLTCIEQEYNLKLFTPTQRRTLFIAHDLNALLRADMTARSSFYEKMRNMGVFSTNTILRRENMNPIPAADGGDRLFISTNLTPLDAPAVVGPGDPGNPALPAPEKAPAPEPAPDAVEPSLDPGAPPEDKARALDGAMDGNQLFSLKRIVNDVALGELPYSVGMAMILAAFPSLTPEQVDDMIAPLAGFTPASIAKAG